MNRWLLASLAVVGTGALCLVIALAISEPPPEPSDFLRFLSEKKGEGKLETASITYRRRDGAEVTLIGAVHVGEREYYRRLQEDFATYEALLYEMVHEEGARPTQRSDSLLSSFQRGLQYLLELEFQLDAIDYSRDNFVHADLDPETFFRLQSERGESLLSLMFKAMLAEWKRQGQGEGSQLNAFHLLGALASRDRARALKLLLAREFEGIEALVAGIEEGGDGRGTVLLSGRNDK
ncbi:MAG: hypothetical protein O7J95_03930, partial [Planctomycetota bacterium]|nr:hypothetical protein [Planctomycetota bacterium]